jgi:uncharacterized protein YwqG
MPDQLPDFQTAVEAAGLGAFWPRLAPHCRPSVRVLPQAAPAETLPLGASRLGGLPDLPAGTAWPAWQGRSLSFLAQLNLADLAAFEAAAPLPPTGLLSFFYDALEQPWGYDPADRGRAVVLYQDADIGLEPQPQPADLSTAEYTTFPVVPLAFAAELTLPDLREQEVGITEDELTEAQREAYWDLEHRHGDGTSRVLGNPDAIQGTMRDQCALVSRGINTGSAKLQEVSRQATGLSEEEVAALVQQAPDEWLLLLQLDSHETEANMMWGDSGRLYFWIPRAALAARDFGQVWQVLQCF